MLAKNEAYNAELYHKADKILYRHGFLIEGLDPLPMPVESVT